MTIPRRAFLARAQQVAFGACALGARAALPMIGMGCVSVPYVIGERRDNEVHVPFSALDKNGRALVEVPELDLPLFVRRTAGGTTTALSTECTHRGCEVEPSTDRLVCPCHGSEYDLEGAVLQGPAARPLLRFAVRELPDRLVIQLSSGGGFQCARIKLR